MEHIAVISDIHSNLEALQAVLGHIRESVCSRIICLGDTVGYGADPEDCAKLVRENCKVSVMGNHDLEVVRPGCTGMGELAAIAIDYTCRNISRETVDWLASQQMSHIEQIGEHRLVFAHGCYPAETDFPYLINEFVSAATMSAMQDHGLHIGFFGHTHLVNHFHAKNGDRHVVRNGMFDVTRTAFTRKPCQVHIFNVGSVGQPRCEQDWRATYVSLEIDGYGVKSVNLHRVGYDVHKARSKILDAKLPPYLGDRLLQGWLPALDEVSPDGTSKRH